MGRKDKKASKRKLDGEETLKMVKKKELHEDLSSTIKSLHWKLRKEYRANNEDHKRVWQQHTEDTASMQKYAKAMHSLATQHWGAQGHTRIHWCRDAALEYFLKDGLKLALEKDERRRVHEELKGNQELTSTKKADTSTISDVIEPNEKPQVDSETNNSLHNCSTSSLPTNPTSPCPKSINNATETSTHDFAQLTHSNTNKKKMSPNNPINEGETCKLLPESNKTCDSDLKSCSLSTSEDTEHGQHSVGALNAITHPFDGNIRLLDVGSCYNPFQQFPQFDAVGIDLCPATDSVYQCDFLSLSVSPMPHVLTLSSPLTHLPASSFHCVVFSLLLEYLPSRLQRWQCCLTAHSLLPLNGLLVIITPDSNSVNKNAPMMKSWKAAIEDVGFRRWRYEKQAHIHCMVFRKTTPIVATMTQEETARHTSMMYIPQDFSEDPDLKPENKHKTGQKRQKTNLNVTKKDDVDSSKHTVCDTHVITDSHEKS